MATQATKRIDVGKIESIRVSFDNASEELSGDIQSSLIEAPVTESFITASNTVNLIMGDIVETVDSLDQYMDAVAEAFKLADQRIADAISNAAGVPNSTQAIGDRIYTQAPTGTPHSATATASASPATKNSPYQNKLKGATKNTP